MLKSNYNITISCVFRFTYFCYLLQSVTPNIFDGQKLILEFTPCPNKSLHFFLNNFDKFKLIFLIFGTHYHNDTLYLKHLKLVFKIYFSLNIANLIVTSSKCHFADR